MDTSPKSRMQIMLILIYYKAKNSLGYYRSYTVGLLDPTAVPTFTICSIFICTDNCLISEEVAFIKIFIAFSSTRNSNAKIFDISFTFLFKSDNVLMVSLLAINNRILHPYMVRLIRGTSIT
eukprot:5109_1